VGGKVTLPGSHLVDSPGNKLTQAHERPRSQCGRLEVITRGWEKGGGLFLELLSYSFLQGGIGAVHHGLGGEGQGRVDQVGVYHRHPR